MSPGLFKNFIRKMISNHVYFIYKSKQFVIEQFAMSDMTSNQTRPVGWGCRIHRLNPSAEG